jgi:hypothetical protein
MDRQGDIVGKQFEYLFKGCIIWMIIPAGQGNTSCDSLQSRFLAYLLEFSHYWGKGIRTLLGFGLVQVRKQTEMPAMALKKPVKP